MLPADESHHAAHVLRVSPPDIVTVSDGHGTVARCAVREVTGGRVTVEVLEHDTHRRPRPEIAVYQGAAKGHKIDEVVAVLAEIGAAELWVYEAARSVVRWDEAKNAKLSERWQTIAASAAKQSRNRYVMTTGATLSWSELMRRIAREPYLVVLWEEASLPLRTALADGPERVALVVGPEGGLERAEAEALAGAGGQLTSLGPRILRTEHAPVVATSALLYHYGLIG